MGEADSASGLKNFTSLEAFAAKEFGAACVLDLVSTPDASHATGSSRVCVCHVSVQANLSASVGP